MDNDEFMMHSFKVYECGNKTQHDRLTCRYFHRNASDRRRNPNLYRRFECPDFSSCSKGESCENAHGVFEVGLHPGNYKTKLCRYGAACDLHLCFDAHTPKQVRPIPPDPNPYAHIRPVDLSSYPDVYVQVQQQQQRLLNEANIWPTSSMPASNAFVPRGAPAMDLSSYVLQHQQQQQRFLNEARFTNILLWGIHRSYPGHSVHESSSALYNQSQQRPSMLPLIQTQTPDHSLLQAPFYESSSSQTVDHSMLQASLQPWRIPQMTTTVDVQPQFLNEARFTNTNLLNTLGHTDRSYPGHSAHESSSALYNQCPQQRLSVLPPIQTQTPDHSLLQSPFHESSSSQTVDHSMLQASSQPWRMPQMTATVDVQPQFLNEACSTLNLSNIFNFQSP